ncbi:hypothetical protein J2T12_002961 [Paenibacillus anaericanus]|nr:hypothetical protein [Paenibacillus anaericanus]
MCISYLDMDSLLPLSVSTFAEEVTSEGLLHAREYLQWKGRSR